MKNILVTLLVFLACGNSFGQELQQIPKDANTIIVKRVGFLELCNLLLDNGYTIAKKDNELQTAETLKRQYDKYWNATYYISIRVKDSLGYIIGYYTAPPDGSLSNNQRAYNMTNRKGIPFPKGMPNYVINKMNELAIQLKREIEYVKQ